MTDYIRSPVFQIKCAQLVSFLFYFSAPGVPEKWVQTLFHHSLKDWTFLKTLWPVAHNYNMIKCTLTVFWIGGNPTLVPPLTTHSHIQKLWAKKVWNCGSGLRYSLGVTIWFTPSSKTGWLDHCRPLLIEYKIYTVFIQYVPTTMYSRN